MNPRGRVELALDVVRRAQQGDRRAQAEVLERYAGPVHQFMHRAAPDREPAELTQGALQRVLEVLPKFDPGGAASLTTWVFTVAHHFLIDALRRKRLHLVPLEVAEGVPDSGEAPSTALWRSQVRKVLEAAIAQLPEEQRRVFVLVQVHEQSLEAVAAVEGIPVGTVKSRLFRAKAALAHRLGPHFSQGGDDGLA